MRRTVIAALLVASVAAAGCEDDVTTGGGDNGRLRIALTDAPGDLDQAWVQIEEIVLIRNEADSLGGPSEGRIVIEPLITDYINLLDLTQGQIVEIADVADIPEGSYSQLRVVIGDAFVVLNDGRVFATPGAELPDGLEADGTLRCPSCAQSGFKVMFDQDGLVINGTTFVTIDFDAGRSFGHQAGNSGQWIMRPVLHATATNHDFAQISGVVTLADTVTLPPCGDQENDITVFQPLAIAGTDTLSAVVNEEGEFQFGLLFPGTYTLSYVQDVTFTNGDSLSIVAEPSVASVVVSEGETETANYEVTAATCH